MRNKVITALNKQGRQLLNEVENYAGIEVQFLDGRKETELETWVTPEGGAIASCHANHVHAKVFLFGEENIRHAVIHELLHVQLNWCERIPQINPIEGLSDNWHITGAISTFLDHLIIIPREKNYALSNWNTWGKGAKGWWKSYTPKMFENEFTWRFKSLIEWVLTTETIVNKEVGKIATQRLKEARLLDEAIAFRDIVLPMLGDHNSALSFMARYFGLDLSAYRIITFDVRTRSFSTNEIIRV